MLVADPDVDPLGLLACKSLAENHRFALIRYFAQVDSTNSAALIDLETDHRTPRLYTADIQTAGRGRHGRNWVADAGTLTFSLAVSVSKDVSRHFPPISIAAGVALARTIEHLAPPFSARLKWPNDVYLDGGKVAGILIEAVPAKHDVVVIGVGLNVATNFSRRDLLGDTPTKSIIELSQQYPHRYHWLAECVDQLLGSLDELAEQPQRLIDEYRKKCLLTGAEIRYLNAGSWQQGECQGIDLNGALLVRCGQIQHRLTSGEVTRVRRV